MRVTLVQPPSGLYETGDLAPPLGLLTVAAFLEEAGFDLSLVDMNVRGITDHGWVQDNFYENALAAILVSNPDVVGFTSMALESHVCLELARLVKASDSAITTVLGGPHFSAIASHLLELYPWIDFVIAGEGERAAVGLLHYLQGKQGIAGLSNVAHRRGRDIVLNRELKPLRTMNELPFPAYHLVDLSHYFEANPMRLLDYEHGRGCVFRCSFCYSPAHWGQGEQIKHADRIAAETGRLKDLGARHLFFVQDNFPNSMPAALSICDALIEARSGLTWNCYATLPQLKPNLLDRLARSGCTSVFVGVDAVSARSKSAFAKHFFKGWNGLSEKLQACLDRDIVPTCAFMIDPPNSDCADTDAALTVALYARTVGCGIRLNTLTLYNQSATSDELSRSERTYTNLKPLLLLDTPNIMHDNRFAQKHPALFPFHNTHLRLGEYRKFVVGMHIAYTLFTSFYRTLAQYVMMEGGSLWRLLEHIGEKIGDLSAIHPLVRRAVEREVFLQEFAKLRLSRETLSALELETAEYNLGRNEASRPVTVQSGAGSKTYRSGRFELIRLVEEPGAYDRLGPLKINGSEDKSYLLVRNGHQIDYFKIRKEILPTLNKIKRAQETESLQIPTAWVSELVQSGALELM
ncbi:MAG: B12-binding domain-containing radical SAM protein [Hyphomicrobiales bacterium]|nr:B12-binding domain-containing radical SAM protein [Hyphomicrobiales bacterium]MBV8825902.1 B12-binding domain-containing radical SAM protein [Hyphomicrobiales bacterium]